MAETHTTGRLKIGHGGMPDDSGFSLLSDNVGAVNVRVVAECWPCSFVSEDHRKEVIANGHRLVACWNALDGLDPAAVRDLLAEREGLLDALRDLVAAATEAREELYRCGESSATAYEHGDRVSVGHADKYAAEIHAKLDAAIQKATQTGATHD